MKIFWMRTAAVVIAVCMLLSANAYAADRIETQNFHGDVTEAEKYGAYCVIPEGTKEIPDGRYTENNFDNLVLNEGLESIGSEAFVNDLPFFWKVYIPASVKSIGDNAFGYSSYGNRLTGFVIFGHSGTEAERYAKREGFKFVTINCDNSTGENILTIDDMITTSYTFGRTFDKVIVNPGASVYDEDFSYATVYNLILNDDGSGKKITLRGDAFSGIEIETLYVPSNVVFEQDRSGYRGSAFSGCKNLKTAYIASEVCNGMFSGCSSLKEVYFTPDNIATEVDDRAFEGCTALEKIDFTRKSNNKLTIGYMVFDNCPSLKEIIWGSNVECYSYFHSSKNLEKVMIFGSPDPSNLIDCSFSSNAKIYMFKKYCDLYGDPKSNFYIQNAVPLHTIYEVDYALSNSSINDYNFHVDDRADKLQVIEETGATRTFNRHAGNVSIESYSANGQRVNDMSADLAYEVWTVHTRLTPGTNLQVRSKYGLEWSEIKHKFTVTTLYSDQTLKSAEISSNKDNGNYADCKIVTGSGVTKVRIEYEDGMTTTLNTSAATFNESLLTYTYNITVKPRHTGKNEFKLYIKTPTDGWKYQQTLTYTVK